MSGRRRRSSRDIFLGIDFSGSPSQWQQRPAASAVWIAQITGHEKPALADLRRVQDLPGDAPPFERLAALLRAGDFSIAGIDAPFSPPAGYFAGTRAALLKAVRALPCSGRPFATGGQLVALLAPELAPRGRHAHRATEQVWRRRRINVRSVLWNGPRGGAPFAAACMTLIAQCGLPAWPWCSPATRPLLVETFPAAQLRTWDLPWFGYNGSAPAARRRRESIVSAVVKKTGLSLTKSYRRTLAASADALDSVLCALAARAVASGALAEPPGETAAQEGWIVVHR
ncbi:MAG TPA: DUF429 domain-containing protein [Alphaproteobacteria bacterium]|nr:DUF429 domain-containing protein [Alphaproteobacteria bacterium]